MQPRRGRPKTVKEKRIQPTVRTKPLAYDPEILQSLREILVENGWTMHPEDTTLIFKKELRRVLYIRRHNIMQLYWAGYGTVSLERLLSDFESTEEILSWIAELEELTLPERLDHHEELSEEDFLDDDEIESLSSMDIINRIFS